MSDLRQHTIGLLFHNTANRRLLCEHLIEEGYTVRAPTPETANLTTWNDVSLIISDLACARQKTDALLEVKERSDKIFLPLLIALEEDIDAMPWLSAGFDDVVRLPITKVELQARLQTVLRMREQSQELAQRSEKMYRALVEQSLVGVALVVDGQFKYVNDAARRIFGYDSVDDLMSTPPLDLAHPDDREFAYENMRRRLARAADPPPYRIRGVRKDGSAVHVEVFGRRIVYNDRPAVITTIVDVTEQVQAKEHDRFQADILRNVRDSVIVTDLDGRIVYWNEGAEAIFGYTADEMIGESTAVTYPTLDSDALRKDLANIIEEGEYRAEWEGRHKDGSTVWIDIRTTPMYDADGELIGFIGIGKDITERVRAREALRRSKARLEALVGSIDEVVFEFDREGTYLNVWTEDETLLARPRDELLGRRATEVLGESFARPFVETFRRVLDTGEPATVEYPLETMQGHKWFLARISPIPSEHGPPQTVSLLARDITARKKMEQDLRRSEQRFRTTFEGAGIGMAIVDERGQPIETNPALQEMLGYDDDEFRQMVFTEYTHPADAAVDMAYYQELIAGERTHYQVEKRFLCKNGDVIWGRLNVSRLPVSDDTPAYAVAMVEDITQRKHLFDAERTARQHAEALRTANVALTQTLDLDVILETLLDCLQDLISYDSGCVMLWEEDRTELVVAAIRGYDELERPEETVLGHSYDPEQYRNLGFPMTSHESLIIDNVGTYPDWDRSEPGSRRVESWIGVPLGAGGEVYGMFSLDKYEPGFFTEEHRQLAEAIAGQAAVAIQNAQLFEQVHAGRKRLQDLSERLVEVQEEERQRIAVELHDEIGQILTGLKLTLEMAVRTLPAEVQQKLELADDLTEELIDKVRRLSLDLRPSILDDLGLLPTLLWFFERYTTQTGIDVKFQHSGIDRRFPSTTETTAYRVTQEALTNVARHTDVDSIDVRVWATDARLCVKIEDDGPGFDVDAVLEERATGGVAGMQERTNLIGGWLTIESAPGAGTTLLAELPVGSRTIERRAQERTV